MKTGIFCKTYGKTLRNRILEYMLEMEALDFSIGDSAEWLNISKPRMYQLIKDLEQQNIAKKTRTVSGTQLYTLNKEDPKTKLLQKNFKECLKIVIKEHKPRKILVPA